jgi:hypothetical protein
MFFSGRHDSAVAAAALTKAASPIAARSDFLIAALLMIALPLVGFECAGSRGL